MLSRLVSNTTKQQIHAPFISYQQAKRSTTITEFDCIVLVNIVSVHKVQYMRCECKYNTKEWKIWNLFLGKLYFQIYLWITFFVFCCIWKCNKHTNEWALYWIGLYLIFVCLLLVFICCRFKICNNEYEYNILCTNTVYSLAGLVYICSKYV